MKKLGYWGKHDVCVRCGQYIYNISIWLDPNRSNKTERPKEELPQAYLDILEKREWSVCDYTDDGRVELEWYSPAGEDFIVCVKVENFPDEILDYSDSFDPDEHIAMWIEAKQNGTKGVPGARQIVHDAEEIEKELDDLLETLTYWLSFAAVALSVIVVAAYVWHKAAEQKATRVEPRKRKDGMT